MLFWSDYDFGWESDRVHSLSATSDHIASISLKVGWGIRVKGGVGWGIREGVVDMQACLFV